MKRILAFALFALALFAGPPLHASEKPELLALFDRETDAIQLEFENQAAPGCFWSPYRVRDAIAAELERLGLRRADSSLYVLTMVAWGIETDDYHCSVVLESELRRHSVTVQATGESAVNTDVQFWDASDLLAGPKITMQDRIQDKAIAQINGLNAALLKSQR